MTIASTARKAGPLLGDGSATSFSFGFKVFATGDVKVAIADSAGVETVLTEGTHYTVSLNANQETSPGGSVTYPVSGSPLPVGSVLSVIGDLDYDQPLDLPSGGNFSPLALENQLDRATIQIQQLREEMDRTAKLPPTSSESVEKLVDDLQRIADSADNLDSVAGSLSAVNTVATSIADVNTVASNLTDVTNFSDVYYGPSAANPTLRKDGSALQGGDLYFNTGTQRLRVFDGTAWVDGPINAGTITLDTFSGTGSQTAFTLSVDPVSENNAQVFIGGVYQQKSEYSVSGTTLTFSAAPAAGTNNIEVLSTTTLALGTTDAALVGFQQAGTGAVATTVQSKLRDVVSVKDFGAVGDGVADDTSAIQAAINHIKTIGGGSVVVPSGNYLVSSKINIWGTFGYRGIHIDGQNAQITSTQADAAFHFRPDPRPDATDPAPQLKQRSELSGLTFLGPGKEVVGSIGILISDGATVDIRQCKARDYEKGLAGVGALICRFTEVELYSNRWGAWFTSTATFAPNDLHFLACKIFENTSAVFAEKFPNGVLTFNECEMEGNNINGTDADGIVVFDFDKAGTVNITGSHLESNHGQWHIRYAGGAIHSALNIVGSQLIPGDKNTSIIEMSNLHGSYGHLQVVGSRVSSGLATQISMSAGTSACVIGDPVGNITGDLGKVVLIRNGRIANGVNGTPGNAGMRSKGSSNIAHDFEGQIRFVDAANTRLAYLQATAGGTMALVHDVDNKGVQFNTKIAGASAIRFHIGRDGALSTEPGADNTYGLGSASLRWGTVYAGTSTINTSDARSKQQIRTVSDAEKAAALRCKALIRAFKFNDAVEVKGGGARIHFGVIAQDVKAAFEDEGLVAEDYALLCYDEWKDVLDDDGNVVTPAGNRYGVRYEELLAFIISVL